MPHVACTDTVVPCPARWRTAQKPWGVAEGVLCPVRCMANAFSCVLSGWWQATITAVQTAGCFVMLLVSKTKKKEN